MPTLEELEQEYKLLQVEEDLIPEKIQAILDETNKLEQQIYTLRQQAQEMDLKISEMPAQVFEKQCNTVLFFKSCGEVPVPNPKVAEAVNQRNNLIRQANDLQTQINNRYTEITKLTARQVDIEKRQLEIQNLVVAERQKIVAEPLDIISLLFGRKEATIQAQISPEKLAPETVEKLAKWTDYLKKYLPYIAVGAGLLLVLRFVKKKKKEVA